MGLTRTAGATGIRAEAQPSSSSPTKRALARFAIAAVVFGGTTVGATIAPASEAQAVPTMNCYEWTSFWKGYAECYGLQADSYAVSVKCSNGTWRTGEWVGRAETAVASCFPWRAVSAHYYVGAGG